jgi:hypothetical protein
LRQTTARVGQLSVFIQVSIVIRSAFSIAGLSAMSGRGPSSSSSASIRTHVDRGFWVGRSGSVSFGAKAPDEIFDQPVEDTIAKTDAFSSEVPPFLSEKEMDHRKALHDRCQRQPALIEGEVYGRA